ncbi:MAG: riboflavin synthase [Cyclobacteriaceae bacterium]|jgi:riboflavin synthase|nr:riboflavin synthase [Cyclobacteriaceae bacterium]
MFTGIIETTGLVKDIVREGTNRHVCLTSPISHELTVDQSVSHDGVCLTVTKVEGQTHWVTAVEETLVKTNVGQWLPGRQVNVERCMVANGRFDGHIVQGHVDQTGRVRHVEDRQGSWLFQFEYDPAPGNVTVEKGSIAVNGTSLTCFHSADGRFSVAIIPYTYEFTNFHQLKPGDVVNLEFDIIGKYVKRLLQK